MRKTIVALLVAALLLSGCGAPEAPPETPDPHAGMVQVAAGNGTQMWVKEYEDLPRNPLRKVPRMVPRKVPRKLPRTATQTAAGNIV